MPQLIILVIAAVVALIGVLGPLRWSAGMLVAVALLVPDAVAVPYAFHFLTILRLAILATTLGLVVRAARGEIPWSVLRASRVHVVLFVYVAYAYFAGVAGQGYPAQFSPSLNVWFTTIDQLLFLGCAVAFVRLLGVRWVAGCVAAAAGLAGVIAVGEWATAHSYARLWFEHTAGLTSTGPGGLLEVRGGSIRVRGAAEFALEFAWVGATLLPVALAAAVTSRRRILWAVPALMVFGIVETFSRSAFLGILIGLVVLVVLSRFDRRMVSVVGAAAVAAGLVYLAVPALRAPLKAASSTDSVSSRERRLGTVTAAITHPLTGLGFDGTAARGVTSTDDSFLYAYASVGALGLVLLLGAVLVPAVEGAVAAWRLPPDDRMVVAAATGGLIVGLASAAAYDSLAVPGSAVTIWLLAAIAASGARGIGDRARAGEAGRAARPSPVRLLLPVAGLSAGLVLFHLSAGGTAVTSELNVLSSEQLDVPASSEAIGSTLATAVCTAGDAASTADSGVSASCQPDGIGPGTATLRLAGHDAGEIGAASQAFDAAAVTVAAPYRRMVVRFTDGRPAPARVAPAVGAVIGAGLALLTPPRRRRSER